MLKCPKCKSKNWIIKHKDMVDPARDKFNCNECNKTFTLYEGTKYEWVKPSY